MQLLHSCGLVARAGHSLKEGRLCAAPACAGQRPGHSFANAKGGINENGHRKQLPLDAVLNT